MIMANSDSNYNSLLNERNPFQEKDDTETENEDTPRNSGVMIHIVPETSKARWNHIEDLDSFFTRMYCYHQKHGFSVIVLDEIFQLLEIMFVVWLLSFTVHCIRYPILFGEVKPNPNQTKVYLEDVFIPMNECVSNFGAFTVIFLIIAIVLFFFRFIKSFYHIAQFWDIKKFFNTALKIQDYDLDNITWHEVQKKIREVQSEQQMCIHKEQLTELDIYHRILRFKNYLVALMNKNLLPTTFKLPIIGEVVSLSRGLLYNLEFILFRGPWALFENHWQLRGELVIRSNRIELAKKLKNQIMWLALANLILSPFIFLYQLIYISFSYAAILRKEPGSLGVRTWSRYGRLYLRHFNELDHELDARLNRAYEPADKYMSSFSSPLVTVIAKNVLFVCGGIFLVVVTLGIYEEHVFQVEHILIIVTVLSGVGVICRILIPDENLIWCPEQLVTAVLAHVHYLPSGWKGLAHTTMVRKDFGNFFQFKATFLLNELISPIVTPFVLLFVFRPRALDIVDFFRSFTVSVVGVGNVCSFAQMDIRKHGNPDWQLSASSQNSEQADDIIPEIKNTNTKIMNQGENGKTELSLIHFTLTNPDWKMPAEAKHFMREMKQHALHDLQNESQDEIKKTDSAMEHSLMLFGSLGEEYSSMAHSVIQHKKLSIHGLSESIHGSKKDNVPPTSYLTSMNASNQGYDFDQMLHQNLGEGSSIPHRVLHDINEDEIEDFNQYYSENKLGSFNVQKSAKKKGVRKSEGSIDGPSQSLLFSLYALNPHMASNPTDITTADMCLSTLYLHEIHHRQVQKKSFKLAQSQKLLWERSHVQTSRDVSGPPTTGSTNTSANIVESTPLLSTKRS